MGKYFCQNKKCNENDNFSKSISNDIESILSLASEININSHNVYNLPVLGFNDIVMEKSVYNPKKVFALNEFIDLSREAMDNEIDWSSNTETIYGDSIIHHTESISTHVCTIYRIAEIKIVEMTNEDTNDVDCNYMFYFDQLISTTLIPDEFQENICLIMSQMYCKCSISDISYVLLEGFSSSLGNSVEISTIKSELNNEKFCHKIYNSIEQNTIDTASECNIADSSQSIQVIEKQLTKLESKVMLNDSLDNDDCVSLEKNKLFDHTLTKN